MTFSKFIFKRLLLSIPLLIGITLISYCLMLLAPGDPTAIMMDPKVKPEDLLRIKHNLGLDRPVIIQYWIWLKNIIQGNFGYSLINGRPVLQLILERLPSTILLMVSSLVLTITITIPLGILSAVKQNKKIDKLITFLTFTGMSIPTFWLALILILVFSLNLRWFPSSGMYNPINNPVGFAKFSDIMKHMFLPLLTMTVGGLAGLTKYMRTGMIKVLKQEYILAARAQGFSEKFIIWKYSFKNAVLTIITILGLSLPVLVGGSFIIEYLFAWPGMGRLGVNAIFMRDFPVIMGILLISSFLIILGNLIADVSYVLVDPRISYEAKK